VHFGLGEVGGEKGGHPPPHLGFADYCSWEGEVAEDVVGKGVEIYFYHFWDVGGCAGGEYEVLGWHFEAWS